MVPRLRGDDNEGNGGDEKSAGTTQSHRWIRISMDEQQQRELQQKHKNETSAMMRRVLVIGAIKLAILAAISAAFVYWYMYD